MSEVAPDPALRTYTDADQFKLDVAIDPSNLATAFQQHAALYAMYAQQAISARRQFEIAEKKFEITEACLDAEHRARLKEENPKTTEAQVRSAVVTDPRWAAISMRVINAKHEFQIAGSCERSFDQRKDMLQLLGRSANREISNAGTGVPTSSIASSKERYMAAAAAMAAAT